MIGIMDQLYTQTIQHFKSCSFKRLNNKFESMIFDGNADPPSGTDLIKSVPVAAAFPLGNLWCV